MNFSTFRVSITKIKKFFFPTKYDLEQRDTHKARLLLYSQFIKPGDLCFDIGANFGNRTSVFLELGAKVVALEPQANCIAYLNKKFANKAIFLQKGAGEKNEIKDFYVSEKYNELSSFSKNWLNTLKDRVGETTFDKIEKIEMVTIDTLIEEYGKPAFIKIDVEGFEDKVLKGLTKNFTYLSFEFAVPEMLNNLITCLQIIHHNYPLATYNFSVGEKSTITNKTWATFTEMIALVNQNNFITNYAGDIYVSNNYQ